MGGNTLINIRPFVEDDNINQSGQAIDLSFFHAQRGELKRTERFGFNDWQPQYGQQQNNQLTY